MRPLRLLFAIVAALAFLPACVSGAMARENVENVGALGAELVAADPSAAPVVDQALEDAEALAAAAGTLAQVTSLGVPAELLARNLENVKELIRMADTATMDAPNRDAARAAALRAARTAGAIAGRAAAMSAFREAAKKTPLGGVIDALAAAATAASGLYVAVRGPKHLGAWWSNRRQPPPAPPAAAPTAPTA